MSDIMLHGVLEMPIDLWSDSPIDQMQRHGRYVQASKRIKEDAELIESLRQQLAESNARIELLEHDANTGNYETLYAQTVRQLAESQAREKVLRDALNIYVVDGQFSDVFGESIARIKVADLLEETTALDSAIRQAKREALLQAADYFESAPIDLAFTIRDILRRMADELK